MDIMHRIESHHNLHFIEASGFRFKLLNLLFTTALSSIAIACAINNGFHPVTVMVLFTMAISMPYLLLTLLATLSIMFVHILMTVSFLTELTVFIVNTLLGYSLYIFPNDRAY